MGLTEKKGSGNVNKDDPDGEGGQIIRCRDRTETVKLEMAHQIKDQQIRGLRQEMLLGYLYQSSD